MKQNSTRTMGIIFLLMIIACSFFSSVTGGVVGFRLANSTVDQSQALEPRSPASAVAERTLPSAPIATTQIDPSAVVNAVQSAMPAVVTVITHSGMGEGSGSGFFVSQDGYLVTNNHVIEGVSDIAVIYASGGRVPAKLIGTAPEFDLAVLKVDGPIPAFVAWGDSTIHPLGATVIAIGSALGEYRNTVTAGILSGFNRQVGDMGSLLQTDAAINQGNSGGPLVDLNGQVVGVNTLVVRGNFADAEGLGFAIPSNIARSVVRNLIETGDARHPFLGIRYQALNPQLANEMGMSVTEGALLETVLESTPASQAGLRPGDIIVSLNGRTVDDRNSLVSLLLEHVAGETISLEVLRGGQIIQTELTLGERV